jgi:general secretion pathway protein H
MGGFTLIETVVVVAILGLALTLILSYGPPTSGGAALKAATASLVGGLREARAQAIAGNRSVSLTVDLTNRTFTIGGQPATALPADIGLRLITVAGETTGSSTGSIRFLPDGSSTGGRIELVAPNRRIQVGVDWLSGRASVVDGR